MDSERFARIREIALAVADLSAAERAAHLDHACGDDAELRREVEGLLRHDATSAGLLATGGLIARLDPVTDGGLDGTSAETRDGEELAGGGANGEPAFRLLRLIGRGGMGEVYEAEDLTLGRRVAVKFLSPHLALDPEAERRFMREARAASALDHPCIGAVHGCARDAEGRLYIVMALHTGGSLRERLAAGPLPPAEALDLACQIAGGLAAAHEMGILHRDLKPGNVMFGTDGGARIIDFGLAKLLDGSQATLTRTGSSRGTLAYMSPEQITRGEADARSDVFALGVTLHEMLTGRLPFAGEGQAGQILSIVSDEPRLLDRELKRACPGLERVLRKALAKRREARYADAGEFLADLELLRDGASTSRLNAPAFHLSRRMRRLLLALVAALPLLGIGLWLGTWGGGPPASSRAPRVLAVTADGSGAYPTIQAALDAAAPGDTVLLANGVYRGDGNRDLDFGGRDLVLRSARGDPDSCVIDCEGGEKEAHRGVHFRGGESGAARVEGLGIVNGWAAAGGGISILNSSPTIANCVLRDNVAADGGALDIMLNAAPLISDCRFEGNRASQEGGAVYAYRSGPRLERCVFAANEADVSGGALKYLSHVSERIRDCLFVANVSSNLGGAIALENHANPHISFCSFHGNGAARGGGIRTHNSAPSIENCIIAFGVTGEAVSAVGSPLPTLTCCDLFGNAGGDWVGFLAEQDGQDGNLAVDPLFADPAAGDLGLRADSPCRGQAACGWIGVREGNATMAAATLASRGRVYAAAAPLTQRLSEAAMLPPTVRSAGNAAATALAAGVNTSTPRMSQVGSDRWAGVLTTFPKAWWTEVEAADSAAALSAMATSAANPPPKAASVARSPISRGRLRPSARTTPSS